MKQNWLINLTKKADDEAIHKIEYQIEDEIHNLFNSNKAPDSYSGNPHWFIQRASALEHMAKSNGWSPETVGQIATNYLMDMDLQQRKGLELWNQAGLLLKSLSEKATTEK